MANFTKTSREKLQELKDVCRAERFSERLTGIGYLLLLAAVLITALLFWLCIR